MSIKRQGTAGPKTINFNSKKDTKRGLLVALYPGVFVVYNVWVGKTLQDIYFIQHLNQPFMIISYKMSPYQQRSKTL